MVSGDGGSVDDLTWENRPVYGLEYWVGGTLREGMDNGVVVVDADDIEMGDVDHPLCMSRPCSNDNRSGMDYVLQSFIMMMWQMKNYDTVS